jgi:extracellular factor (EF) 3-hydroxypalmitic acid methyl ester biosynthesis protein
MEIVIIKDVQRPDIKGVLLRNSQNQIVFEIYGQFSIIKLDKTLINLEIIKSKETIYRGQAFVNNLINTGLILIVSATIVDPWIKRINLEDLSYAKDNAAKFINEWSSSNSEVLPDYKLSITKIRSFLTDASRWIGQFDFLETQKENELIQEVSEPFLSTITELILDFEKEVKKIEKSKEEIHKNFAYQELHPLMMKSPFAYRTFYKPLGYAGDYEMVNMMLRSPYEGETAYAKLVNLFLLNAGPAEAHRNRIDILYDKIKLIAKKAADKGERANIFNFACGPAIELQRFIEKEDISENCDFTLLDFSKDTLDYTKNELDRIIKNNNRKSVNIKYINKSVNDILRKSVGLKNSEADKHEEFDLVYCAGLFDYLSSRVCTIMLNLFFAQTKNGGEVLATNVHSNNPVQGLMEHFLEWYLTYRDEKDFSQLINQGDKKIYTDKTGYNIFLEIYKHKPK